MEAMSHTVIRRLLFPEDVVTWRLVGRLVALAVALFLLVGAVSLWRHGGGSGSPIVAVLYRGVWIAYVVSQIAVVMAVILVITLRLSGRGGRSMDRG